MGNSKQAEELVRKLKELNRAPMTVEPGVVKLGSVDLANLTCTVVLLNDTEIPDVRLKAAVDEIPDLFTKDGLIQIPLEESTVLVAMIGNDPATRFILALSQVQQVIFYGGLNEGLIRIIPLIEKVNNLESKVNDIVTKFNAHTHAGVTTGAGVSGTTATPVVGSLTPTIKAELEDIKVLH
jgi:hypothetical protein